MSKPYTIIEVDLSATIDSIMADDIKELTNNNRSIIESAIAEQRAIKQVVQKKQDESMALVNSILNIYTSMTSKSAMMSELEILKLCEPHITSISSFSQRMRAWLKKEHPNMQLTKRKEGKINGYVIEQASSQPQQPPDQPHEQTPQQQEHDTSAHQ